MTPNCLFSSGDIAQYGRMDYVNQDTSVIPQTSSGFPASNLLTNDLYQGVQFSNNANTNTQFAIDLGSIQPISIIALLKHNAIAGSYWQVNIYDTLANYQAASALYTSGIVQMTPSNTVFGTLAWGMFQWGETVSEADLAGYNRHAFLPLNAVVLGRYITVRLICDMSPVLFMAYKFWVGTYYQPTFNADYNSELEPIDETSIKKGYTGARTYGQVVKRRQMKLNFSLLPQPEFLANIYGPLFLRNGAKQPFLFIMFPQDSTLWMTTSIYGNLQPQNPNSLPFTMYNQMAATIIIEEAV